MAVQLIRNQQVIGSNPIGGFRRGVKQIIYDIRGVCITRSGGIIDASPTSNKGETQGRDMGNEQKLRV